MVRSLTLRTPPAAIFRWDVQSDQYEVERWLASPVLPTETL
jgi:hypothetical protein